MTKEELLAAATTLGMIAIPDMDVIARAKGGTEIYKGPLSAFPPHIIAQGAAYAFHKKAQDASGGKDLTGAQALDAGKAVIEALQAGTWGQKGGGGPRITTFEAFARSESMKAAKAWMEKNEAKVAGRSVEQIAETLRDNATWLGARQKEWDAKREAPGIDDILG
jgi:hypothetical protein